ncbi:c-type cytochrome [Phenylobacterium montanum]|uniref:Cytochrome c5 family protein n=1 Tax=Phenylobacterium montanum TaxID=2823693 RepID=A0A975G3D2_9CAUL|nr:c-type cytochrome [Caulobacter sp. S6]QUD89757.1 cytochrome c5 family protein [Caulobacter sp. S6]
MTRAALLLCAGLALAACSKTPSRPIEHDPAKIAANAVAAQPADPKLAGLYDTSCKACHGRPGSGAPLALDHTAWDSRWARGLPSLMQSVIGGKAGMPAGGQCFACTEGDYKALVRFMADQQGS